MDLSIFRLYDIRGVCPDQINSEVIYRIARNFNKIFNKGSSIVIGYDSRESSLSLFDAMSIGLEVAGMKVIKIGLTTTPMITFFTNKKGIDGGIMITASHNPMSHNGVKILKKKRISHNEFIVEKISGKEILKKIGTKNIRKDIDILRMIDAPLNDVKEKSNYINKYIKFILKNVFVAKKMNVTFVSQSPLIINISKRVTEKIPNLTIIELNVSDKSFEDIGSFVAKDGKIDMAVVFDIDGDRATFIDNKGRVVYAEYICQLLITCFGYNSFVSDTMSKFLSKTLVSNLKKNNFINLKHYTSKVGGVFVSKKMIEHNVDIGFEYSNHYYFKNFWNADSGIISALMAIEAVSKLPYKLSDFIDFLPHIEKSNEIDIHIDRPQMKDKHKELKDKYKKTALKVDCNDGLNVYFDDAWFNLRASNTENVLRLNIGAYSKKRLDGLKKDLLSIL